MGLLTGLFKRSLESPSTPLSAPDDWLFDSLGSFRASSGVNVNRETALTYDAYWRCCALVSGDVARLPLWTYKRTNAGKEIDENHPAYSLLCEQASDEVSSLDFKRVLTLHAISEGNGYAYIVRDKAGRPIELWPLSPMKTYPVREGGRLWYVTQFGSADGLQQRRLPAGDVFHLKGLSFDGLVGYSVIAKMREAVGLAIAYENFGSQFFRNQATPKVILIHPGRLKPEAVQNLRESWERIHAGLENAHRTAVLMEGMDVKTMQHNARDSQLLEGKEFSRVQICNFFGVPPHKVGDSSRTSYNSLEQENEAYVDDGGGLGYWLPAWEAEARLKLLSQAEREARTHCIKFSTRTLLRSNLTARTGYYTQMLQNGVLSANEVREEEGLNPRDGGDEYMVPLNMQPNHAAPPEEEKPEPAGKPEQQSKPTNEVDDEPRARALLPSYETLVADATRRMVRRIGVHAVKAAKEPRTFTDWIECFEAEHRPVVTEALTPAIRVAQGREDGGGREVEGLFAELRTDLLALAERATPKTLAPDMERLAQQWERDIPARLVRLALAPEGPEGDRAKGAEDLRSVAGMAVRVQVQAGDDQPDHNDTRVSPAVNDYGELPDTEGADGEPLDVFLGTDPDSEDVWVIDQLSKDGKRFDEHKVMMGFRIANDSPEAARAAYVQNYWPQFASRYGAARHFRMQDFRAWLRSYDPKDPVAWVRDDTMAK